MWIHLSIEVLSETLSLRKPSKKYFTLRVSIRYQVLNDEDLTNVDALRRSVI